MGFTKIFSVPIRRLPSWRTPYNVRNPAGGTGFSFGVYLLGFIYIYRISHQRFSIFVISCLFLFLFIGYDILDFVSPTCFVISYLKCFGVFCHTFVNIKQTFNLFGKWHHLKCMLIELKQYTKFTLKQVKLQIEVGRYLRQGTCRYPIKLTFPLRNPLGTETCYQRSLISNLTVKFRKWFFLQKIVWSPWPIHHNQNALQNIGAFLRTIMCKQCLFNFNPVVGPLWSQEFQGFRALGLT